MGTPIETLTQRLSGLGFPAQRANATGGPRRKLERWVPAAAGSVLAVVGVSRRTPAGAALAVAGGALAYGGLSGQAPLPAWLRARFPHLQAGDRGLRVQRAVTIQRPREELYAFWRDLANLPRFMGYLQSVSVGEDGRSHWVAKGPAGSVEWDAQIVEEQPDQLIRWQSLPGARVANRGEVRFQTAPAGRGTEVRVRLAYEPPAGSLGATLAQLLGTGADRQVRESLRNFKQLMEAGETPTNEQQPRGTCRP